ncbi:MAG: hypothetical protein ABSA51_01945 [Anaerolineaceae bacterium]|jgi:hypothetical protein
MTLGTRLKSFLAQPRLILNSLLLLVFSAAWIRDVIYWFPKDAFGTGLDYWAYTDWLIDYSQGFIRRGLSGEIWRLVPAGISPLECVAVFSWVLILIVAFGYVRLVARSWRTLHPLILFGLLFLPSLLFFYLHDHSAIARKEILGTITVLLHLLVVEKVFPLGASAALAEKNLRRYVGWLTPITAIFLPAIILVHEGNFLLFVPLHAMITLTVLRMKPGRTFMQAALWSGLLYLPAALAFGVVYLAGTPGYPTLLGICNKWLAAGALRESSCMLPPDKLSGSTLPGSFIPMQWSLGQAAYITREVISFDWEAWILILPILGISIWYLVRQAVYSILRSRSAQSFAPQSARRYAGLFFRKYFLIPFLFSLPIYFTAYDYGRWFTVTCINFAILAVSANLPCLEFAQRKPEVDESSTADNSPEHLDRRLVFYGASIIICILALVLWLPHYCLFSCDIVQSPLQFFSHTLIAH